MLDFDLTSPSGLRAWLRAQRMTQEQLARALPVSNSAVDSWVSGRRRASPLMARAIREAGRDPSPFDGIWAEMAGEHGRHALIRWRRDLGLSQAELARRLPVGVKAVPSWEAGSRPIRPVVVRALKDFDREWRARAH